MRAPAFAGEPACGALDADGLDSCGLVKGHDGDHYSTDPCGTFPRRGRPRRLLLVPCDTHGADPCPSPNGCKNRRERAGLPPHASGTSGHRRGHPERRRATSEEPEG